MFLAIAFGGAWPTGRSAAIGNGAQQTVTVVSAASFDAPVAPDSIAAAFGVKLATRTIVAGDIDPLTPGIQLPTSLAGTTLEINGRPSSLIFVSPSQINFLVPAATQPGTATVVVRAGDGTVSNGTVQIAAVAPGVFTADGNGQGVPAATLLRAKADGALSYESLARFDFLLNRFVTRPISLGPAGERVFLILFLTGLRGAADPNHDGNLNESVQLAVGGVNIAPAYAGRQGDFAGLDQINAELPRSLIGRGTVDVTVTATGARPAPSVKIEMAAVGGGRAPRAFDESVATDEDAARTITLRGNDLENRPLRYIVTRSPQHGRLSGAAPNLTYTPTADFNGGDDFTFLVNNGAEESAEATITINIHEVNDPPQLAVPGSQSASVGERLSFLVTATDVEQDQTLFFTLDDVGKPDGATVTSEGPPGARAARFSWTPTADQAGQTFTARITVRDNGQPNLQDTKTVALTTGFLWAKTSGPEGGDINTLLVSGANTYAGTRAGGVFRSSDGGGGWTGASAGLADPTVNALLDSGPRLLAGTNDGIFLSDNQAQNWTSSGFRGLPVLSFAAYGTRLFAGTDGLALRVSGDGGRNWTNVTGADFDGADICEALLARNGSLFAGFSDSSGFAGGIFATEDDARTWRRLTAGLPNAGLINVTGFAATRTHLLARLERFGLYASGDNGKNWTSANAGLPNETILALASDGTTLYASTQSGAFVSTNNGQSWAPIGSVFKRPVTAFAFNGARILAGTRGDGVSVSANNAQSFTVSNAGLSNSSVTAFAFNDSGTGLYVGTGRAVFVTNNNGQRYEVANEGLPVGVVFGRLQELSLNALAAVGDNLFSATSQGVFISAAAGGQTWTPVNNGLTNLSVADLAAAGNNLFAATPSGVFLTTDRGQNWRPVNNGLANLQISALVADGVRLYAGTADGVFATANQGQSWARAGFENFPVSLLAVRGNFMVVASGLGVRASNDGGRSWREVIEGLPSAFISALAIRGETAYAGLSLDGAFTLTADGLSWAAANESLSSRSVNALIARGTDLFVGTNDGVSLSTNPGQVWRANNLQLSALNVNTVISQSDGLLAGTRGGGVFRLPDQATAWESRNTGLPPAPNVFVLTQGATAIFAGTSDSGVYRLSNQTQGWNSFGQGAAVPGVTGLVAKDGELFAATAGGVFRANELGAQWEAVNTGLTGHVLSLASRSIGLLGGGESGAIFLTTNRGQSWTTLAQLTSATRPAEYLDVRTFFNNGVATFAGTRGAGIYRSLDAERLWSAVGKDLPPNLPVSSFATVKGRLYAGTVHGVFVSTDQGESWRQINAGLASVSVNALIVRGNKLYAGTANGGVFVSEIPD